MLCQFSQVLAVLPAIAFVLQGCSISPARSQTTVSPTSTSTPASTAITSSPTSSTPSQRLECTTVIRNVSLGQQSCAESTASCFKVKMIYGDSEVLQQSCDDSGLCDSFVDSQGCCTLSTAASTHNIICSATDFDSTLAETDFVSCDRPCTVTTTTSTSAITSITSSPTSSAPSQSLQCTTVSGSISLGQQTCTSGTVACFKTKEVFGVSEVLEQACDESGLCALVGNPQSCCTLSTFFSTQQIICSATDFDSSLDEQDFEDCDSVCDLTIGSGVLV